MINRFERLEKLLKSRVQKKNDLGHETIYVSYSDQQLQAEINAILNESSEITRKLAGFNDLQLLSIYALFTEGLTLDEAIRSLR